MVEKEGVVHTATQFKCPVVVQCVLTASQYTRDAATRLVPEEGRKARKAKWTSSPRNRYRSLMPAFAGGP